MTEKTKKLVLAALMCALTCVATMVIRIPTPTMGYIHPGDALVLLCAFLLGPVPGALAAGIGSMLSDLFSGYLSYVPATFISSTWCFCRRRCAPECPPPRLRRSRR